MEENYFLGELRSRARIGDIEMKRSKGEGVSANVRVHRKQTSAGSHALFRFLGLSASLLD
jgi:hypothetical protein